MHSDVGCFFNFLEITKIMVRGEKSLVTLRFIVTFKKLIKIRELNFNNNDIF